MGQFGLGTTPKLGVVVDHQRIVEALEMQLFLGYFATSVLAPQFKIIGFIGVEKLGYSVVQLIEMIVFIQFLQRFPRSIGPIANRIVPVKKYGFVLFHEPAKVQHFFELCKKNLCI